VFPIRRHGTFCGCATSLSVRSAPLSLRTICSGVCLRPAIVTILPSPTIRGNGLMSPADRSQCSADVAHLTSIPLEAIGLNESTVQITEA
jgi:hypothetical protein